MSEEGNASLGDGGNVGTPPVWHEQLEGSLKGNEGLSQFKTISELANGYLELGKTHTALKGDIEGRVKVPGEGATPEEVASFRKALGVPEKVEEYQVEKPEKFPEGFVYDEALENDFKKKAFELGLTANQVKGLHKFYLDMEMNFHGMVAKEIIENREKSVNALKDVWKGEEYQKNAEKAVRSFHKTLEAINPPQSLGGMEGFKKAFDESGFGDDPHFIYYFSKLFDLISDDTFIKGAGTVTAKKTEPGVLDFSKSMG